MRRWSVRLLSLALLAGLGGCVSNGNVSAVADEAAVFEAAGFRRDGVDWRRCTEVHEEDPYTPGQIESVGDLNGDGLPEMVVTESSLFCYGNVSAFFVLVSRRPDGDWTSLAASRGIPRFLATKGTDGWPDIEVGGPGFCFPVLRWNGEAYEFHRNEYGGKPCEK